MMDQFKVTYVPGGMSGHHSAWWLVEVRVYQGMIVREPVLWLRRSTYN
jgi:hypothetical protein